MCVCLCVALPPATRHPPCAMRLHRHDVQLTAPQLLQASITTSSDEAAAALAGATALAFLAGFSSAAFAFGLRFAVVFFGGMVSRGLDSLSYVLYSDLLPLRNCESVAWVLTGKHFTTKIDDAT